MEVVVEFPVVVVQAETGQVVDEFHRYVRPTESPTLSDFCKKLTGISQRTVDTASDLQQVLQEFENWLELKKKEYDCVFKLGRSNAAVFVTWTDWDIRTCLWGECQRKRLSLPVDLLTRIDLKAVFKKKVVGDEDVRQLSRFSNEELRTLSVNLVNATLLTHCSAESVRLSSDLEVSLGSLFSFMEKLPILDIFFDQLLAEVVSNVLINRISSAPLKWPFMSERSVYVSSEICSWEIVFVSVLRLVDKALCSLSRIGTGNVSECNFQPRSHDSNDLSLLYGLAFEKISEPDDKCHITNDVDFELFLMSASSFLHQSCKVCGQFVFELSHLSAFVPQFRDQTLRLRINLGHNLYLARACHLLSRLPDSRTQFSSKWNRHLTIRDLACLQRFLVSSLTSSEYSHADLMAWAIDRGIFVKDFALVFLKNPIFDDPLCAAKIFPRLIQQVSLLTEDSDVSLALVRKISSVRRINLPTNHHEKLMKELVSLLAPDTKSDILAHLHERPDECFTPLSSEDSKFRCYLRKFFNRLAAGPGLTDLKPASALDKPWRDPRAADTISKEALIDADLLLLTRPIDFLVELMRFPIIQNSAALFPVVYKILSHVNYSFEVHVDGSKNSVLQQLINELVALFETETSTKEDMNGVWRGERYQRIELMRYLPRSGGIDPSQVSLSAHVALFAASSFITAEDGSNDAIASTSRLRKLWIYTFGCIFDQSSTWPQLTDLVTEEVLSVRARAELVVQSLALLLLPRVPVDLPLGIFAVLCVSLLERLRTPLTVRICVTLLTAGDSATDQNPDSVFRTLANRLRAVLSDPEDRDRRLLMQCVDFLPSDLLGTVVITLPHCLIRSNLIDVTALNESTKNRFKFAAKSPQTSNPFNHFAKPLLPSDVEEVLQLVSLCDGTWYAIVTSILKFSRDPEVWSLWNGISPPTLLLALHTFLHRIAPLDEIDAAERWARAVGFVDQLSFHCLISLPFKLRSTAFSSPSVSQPHDILLGNYRGSLDLFDFIFGLLRMVDCSTVNAPTRLHLSLVSQTLAVLGQRLVERLRVPHVNDGSTQIGEVEVDALVGQAILVISELNNYMKTNNALAHSPFKRLSASLEIITNSLTCQQQQREVEEQELGSYL
ncbi:unnamed protein product [Hydatigera taeniaeformis]|uniref:Exonuclease domain-containing protein n=1 Tax=Hydatigena taeniaeformis TaxID=6205 RepID=A0A0R3X2Q7_HYDTA|nr:unnamed protein product [Hydatigera taeniaeformis]